MKRHKAYDGISAADAECDECAAGTADVSQADGGAHGQQMNTFERIYRAVELIPKGRVASYGVIAALAGNSRMSRIVGICPACKSRSGKNKMSQSGVCRRFIEPGLCVRR